jgi:membrane protease YdiL (CAAX protease family)
MHSPVTPTGQLGQASDRTQTITSTGSQWLDIILPCGLLLTYELYTWPGLKARHTAADAIAVLIALTFAVAIWALFKRTLLLTHFGWQLPPNLRLLLWSAAAGILSALLVFLFFGKSHGLFGRYAGPKRLDIFYVATVGPMVEEMLFRGVLWAALVRSATWMRQSKSISLAFALIVSSVCFGLAHRRDGLALAGAIFSGLTFGLWRLATRSLIPGVVMHGMYNATLLVGVVLILRWQ